MSINTITEFEETLADRMERLFGNCKRYKGVLRSMADHLGVSDTGVIFEAAIEPGFSIDEPYPLLHFHTTLAQKIDEKLVPGILRGLNDLNTVISAGAFPSFGCFGYYPPLRQIYLSYRMPVNPKALEAEFENAQFYLGSLYEQLELFADYILFLCEDPDRMTLEDYMDYLDSVADFNSLDARIDGLVELVKRRGQDGSGGPLDKENGKED